MCGGVCIICYIILNEICIVSVRYVVCVHIWNAQKTCVRIPYNKYAVCVCVLCKFSYINMSVTESCVCFVML